MTEPHPDDESLSAALDGEDAAAAAHVATCPACRARSDALRSTAAAVAGAPAGPPVGLADRAVAAAMAAFAAERGAPDGRHPATAPDNVVPLRPAARAVPDSFSSHRTPADGDGGARRVPGWLLGVAAALVAVLVAVPVLSRISDDGGNDTATLATEAGDTSKAAPSAGGPLIEGGDLGDQTDQLALGNLLAGALAGSTQAPAGQESTAAAPSPDTAGAEAADTSRAASPDTFAGAPAPVASAPPADTGGPAVTDPGAAACEAAVAQEYASGLGLGPLVYRATLRWQDVPAVLLAYRLADTSGAGADHQAFVMALDGCRLLVVQGF